ncbi:MAG: SDR family NAD(P)-dependent oxidoreductase, partial [Ilumatobacteraceae bacterium]
MTSGFDLGINGRVALVTGASSGLGLACADALARAGARVVLAARSAERLAGAAATLTGDVTTIETDLSQAGSATRLVEATQASVGAPDILIANAGGPPPGTFSTTALESYPEALQLNLLSTVELCLAAVPGMRERRWGRVVAITSISVREPIPNLILSNTARAGLTGFLKTLSREVAPDGVTVNSLQPGVHETDRLKTVYGDDLSAVA